MPFLQTFDHVEIIYQDCNILVVDKPSGMLSHPAGNPQHPNLVDFFKNHLNSSEVRPVHRLDRKTSGLVVLAKNSATARFYGHVFTHGRLEKLYLAQLQGQLMQNEGILNNFLADDPDSAVKIKRKVSLQGQHALTHFQKVYTDKDSSYVKLFPKTGRRHQLRVHMAHMGHPIMGDPIYDLGDAYYLSLMHSDIVSPRMHLHAYRITLPVQNKHETTFTTAYPDFWKTDLFNITDNS